eukprot:TRINITY_DN22512_c0_g2_i1.p1 TRINITY_DN22512_c0_g2~~TRINITY_DN22512_c0_g2_i1.p1  ORF type:complete len:190 (-),score=28.06 TRINITY_DN22512_c0_g2_i1:173-742(-)
MVQLTGLLFVSSTFVAHGLYCKKDCPTVGNNTLLPGGQEGAGVYTYVSHGGVPVISSAVVQFTKNDLHTGSEPGSSVEKYARSLGDSDDDAGHIFANQLGGKAVPINIFPQSPHINRGPYRKFEEQIYKCMSGESTKATLQWTFTYESSEATRPTHVTYSASFDKGCDDMSQAFPNPSKSQSLEETIVV